MPSNLSLPRTCEHCGSPFMARTRQLRIGKGRFCSKSCAASTRIDPFGVGQGPPRSLAVRFWAKVNKTDSCWLWMAGTRPNGYGSIRVRGADGKWRNEYAHRVGWLLLRGAIPDGLLVLHNCPGGDNKACVRPEHLFLGTHADNSRDAVKKGTVPSGDRHYKRRGLEAHAA